MISSCLWVALVLLGIVVTESLCKEVNGFNKSEEIKLPKIVEVLELKLSQKPEDSDKKNLENEKIPRDKHGVNYEILIAPNKNLPELKGSQKIKIYVETGNYGDQKNSKDSKINIERKEKQNIYDVLPLSIESEGSKVNTYQQPSISTAKYGSEHYEYISRDVESTPSKRQTNWKPERTSSQSDLKILNCPPNLRDSGIYRHPSSYIDRDDPYHIVTVPVKKEQQSQPTYDRDYSFSNQNNKRIIQQSYGDDYVESVENSRKTTAEKEYKKSYERPYHDTEYEKTQLSNERRQGGREEKDLRRPFKHPEITQTKPIYVKENDDYGLFSGRSSTYNRANDEKRPNYEEKEIRPFYNLEPEKSRSSNERYPEYDGQYEEERPSRQHVYIERPEEVRPSKNQRPNFEKESISSDNDGENESSYRPVREDNSSYSGFPESYQHNNNHYNSKPLQYEPVRVFPASPCLNVFKYQGREPETNRWYADIYVTTDEILNGMRLDITLDRPADLLTNWLSEVKTKDSTHFTILSLTKKLVPGPAETVRIMVKFDEEKPIPYLKSINLNGRLICPSSRLQKTTIKKQVYENVADLHHIKTTTEKYAAGQKKPVSFVEEYESTTKRTTAHVERRTIPPLDDARKPTSRPYSEHKPDPNPNGYEETDLNSFSASTKRPPGRPAHSNGKPPPHAAKPAQNNKPGNGHGHGHGQGHGNNKGNSGKNPSASSQNNRPFPVNSNEQGSQIPMKCGTPSVQPSPLITHGQLTSRGQWPWHAALYKNVGPDLTFFCGGSLINAKHVLTAAHCVTKTYTTRPLDENTLVVYLGKYHLKLWSEGGVQNRQVSKIYIHPKYNSTDFRSDIAVLALSTPVEYTDYVRPICLWDRSNTRIEDVEGKLGTVVGWGFDESKKLTEELRQAKMPVVEQKTCLWSYPDFYPQFTSNMTYCAGFKNGTSVCNGDSGGGMVFRYKNKLGEERWYLRGIVSISPARNDSRVCDTSHYVVFTDVAKYLSWLDNFL